MKRVLCVAVCLCLIPGALAVGTAKDDALLDGASRLIDLQQNDGGWDWPLYDGDPSDDSPRNTVAPIAMGLAEAYWNSPTPGALGALANAGGLLLTKSGNFSPSDGYLAMMLDSVFGGTTYRDYVNANFYDLLAAGNYVRASDGGTYDTASYIASIYASRNPWGGGNLAAWDVGIGLVGAIAAGADPTEWIAGTKVEIDRLVEPAWYDVIGLAGALYGLAFAGEEFDPSSGAHAAADSLADLAATLASYQISSGGFSWVSCYITPGEESVQETAYAILALNQLARMGYLTEIQNAADWLVGFQLLTGGWENYTAGGENNEVTGEALWGVYAMYLDLVLVDATTGNDAGFGVGFVPFASMQAAVDIAQGFGSTVLVAHGVYNGDLEISGKVNILSQVGSATHTSINGNISLSSGGVRIGAPLQGFSVYGDIDVAAGTDASTIHLNWNNLFGLITNSGIGMLDARYNFWGTNDPSSIAGRVSGDVDFSLYLPYDADTAYHDILGVIQQGLASDINGAIAYLFALASMSPPDPTVPPVVSILPGGVAGGGGEVTLPGGSYASGVAISGALQIIDPVTGEPIPDAIVALSLMDADGGIAAYVLAEFDPETGMYSYSIDTTGMAPGTYTLIIQVDGTAVAIELEVTE